MKLNKVSIWMVLSAAVLATITTGCGEKKSATQTTPAQVVEQKMASTKPIPTASEEKLRRNLGNRCSRASRLAIR